MHVIIYLRRVKMLLIIKCFQKKTHLLQLSPIVVFPSANLLVLENVILSRRVVI